MSKRLTGLNPLAYVGVEPTNPPAMYISQRPPIPTDSRGFYLGDLWLDEPNESLYVLAGLSGGVASWVTTFGGAANQFDTDSGSAVDVGGVINIVGGDDINTSATGNTITIDLEDSIEIDGLTLPSNPSGVLQTDSAGVVTATNGADGMLLIGGGTEPTWALPQSADNSILFNVGNNTLDMTVDPAVVLDIQAADDGMILIGDTGGTPAWANITSTDLSITITNGANTIDLSAPTASGVTTFNTDGTDATQAAGEITIVGDGAVLETDGAGSTVTVGFTAATNGQLIIGATAGSPAWGNLTSSGATVVITNGPNSINLEATGGGSSGASTFITDSGNALESLGNITIAGGNNIATSGAGQTVTIDLNGTTNRTLQVGNASGSLTSLAAATNGQIPIGSTGANPVIASITAGTGIQVVNGAGSITINATGGGGGGGTIVTTFTSSGTWTKNVDTQYVEVMGWSGGGGGGSGARWAAGSTAQGGGGGGAGGFFRFKGPAMYFDATENVVVGTGGVGAPGTSTNNGEGALGDDGTISSFGNIIPPAFVRAAIAESNVYQGGGGGNAISQNLGSAAGGAFLDSMANRVFGAANFSAERNGVPVSGFNPASLTNTQGGHGSVAAGIAGKYSGGDGTPAYGFLFYLPTSGGQGGSVTSANVASNGGQGGDVFALDGATILAAGGVAGTAPGGAGGDGVDQLTVGGLIFGGTGGGGGGSGAAGGGVGGAGGDGKFPGGGGGGGGASRNGSVSGAGGDGADGYVIVIEWT